MKQAALLAAALLCAAPLAFAAEGPHMFANFKPFLPRALAPKTYPVGAFIVDESAFKVKLVGVRNGCALLDISSEGLPLTHSGICEGEVKVMGPNVGAFATTVGLAPTRTHVLDASAIGPKGELTGTLTAYGNSR